MPGGAVIAVLGGDAREWCMATRLADDGHAVRTYGVPHPDGAGGNPVPVGTAAEAVAGATWLVCPIPGVAAGDVLYAPNAPEPVALTADLLGKTAAAAGGLVLGRATPTIRQAAESLGIRVVEMGEEPAVRWRLSVPTAEAVLGVLMEHTDRVLRDLRVLVLGTGKTATTLSQMLAALGSRPVVAGRRESELARLSSLASRTVAWDDRITALADVDVVVNTVPDPGALPHEAYDACRDVLVVDTASPPGGLRHADAEAAGVRVVWARGLAGKRAAVTAGDAQYEFVRGVIG